MCHRETAVDMGSPWDPWKSRETAKQDRTMWMCIYSVAAARDTQAFACVQQEGKQDEVETRWSTRCRSKDGASLRTRIGQLENEGQDPDGEGQV